MDAIKFSRGMAEAVGEVYQRRWLRVRGSDPGPDDFTVMTYNLLADVHIRPGTYSHCPESLLSQTARTPHIVAEIHHYDPDVVCLQEVSPELHATVLQLYMARLGYAGFHMQYRYRKHDGLALFYKLDRFSLLIMKSFQMEDLVNELTKRLELDTASNTALHTLMMRSRGLLLGQFKHHTTGRIITIGNVHIRWSDFKLPGRQLVEVALCYEALRKAAAGTPFIFCGDFNSTPSFAPYRLLERGNLPPDEPAWSDWPDFRLFNVDRVGEDDEALAYERQELSEESKLEELSVKKEEDVDPAIVKRLLSAFTTEVKLKSAYKSLMGEEPEWTHSKPQNADTQVAEMCVDYLWFTPHIRVTQVLEPPPRESMARSLTLPSLLHPSDHIPLVAGFSLSAPTSERSPRAQKCSPRAQECMSCTCAEECPPRAQECPTCTCAQECPPRAQECPPCDQVCSCAHDYCTCD